MKKDLNRIKDLIKKIKRNYRYKLFHVIKKKLKPRY